LLGIQPIAIDENLLVEDMADGGMGSIRFVQNSGERCLFGKKIAEADYVDIDGVLVSIVLNVDQQGNLYEIDFWKVDFSSICKYPRPEGLRIRS